MRKFMMMDTLVKGVSGVKAVAVFAAVAIAASCMMGVFAGFEDLAEGEVNPWGIVNLSRYPFMCALYELGVNNTPKGNFLPSCVIIAPQFFLTHYTGLDIQDYTLYLNGSGRYDVVAGMEPYEDADYRALSKLKKKVQFQTVENTVVEAYDGSGPFSVLIMGRSKKPFKEEKGYVEFWPLLDVSILPKGHDELCMGLAWLKNPDGLKYRLRRSSFYMRRYDECGMENVTNFPACLSGRAARQLCLAEPTSVVITCQGALLGFFSRFQKIPEDKDKCKNKRNKEEGEILDPERIRVLSNFRYELYYWVKKEKKYTPELPTSEPLKFPWVPPNERPGGDFLKTGAMVMRPPTFLWYISGFAVSTLLSTYFLYWT